MAFVKLHGKPLMWMDKSKLQPALNAQKAAAAQHQNEADRKAKDNEKSS